MNYPPLGGLSNGKSITEGRRSGLTHLNRFLETDGSYRGRESLGLLDDADITMDLFGKFGRYLAEHATKLNGEFIKAGSGPTFFLW